MGWGGQRAALPTILIVEDEFLPRTMLSDHLQECGFMVFEAANADEAITTIETGVPIDLVLTDVRMPGSMTDLAWQNGSEPTSLTLACSCFRGGDTDGSGKRTL
jgi:CheY-like chemotaxis protein